MKISVASEYANHKGIRDGIEYIKRVCKKYDTSRLHNISIKASRAKNAVPGVYGNHRHKPLNSDYGCRISLIIKGSDSDFPETRTKFKRHGQKYGYWLRPEAEYDNLAPIFVWTAMHELYHFLAYTKQLKGNFENEVTACKFAEAMTVLYLHGMV